jgi:hypothetical protein
MEVATAGAAMTMEAAMTSYDHVRVSSALSSLPRLSRRVLRGIVGGCADARPELKPSLAFFVCPIFSHCNAFQVEL